MFKKMKKLHVERGCMEAFDLDQMDNHGNAGLVDVAYNPLVDKAKLSLVFKCAKEQGVSYFSVILYHVHLADQYLLVLDCLHRRYQFRKLPGHWILSDIFL
jgi:hypothetical protein